MSAASFPDASGVPIPAGGPIGGGIIGGVGGGTGISPHIAAVATANSVGPAIANGVGLQTLAAAERDADAHAAGAPGALGAADSVDVEAEPLLGDHHVADLTAEVDAGLREFGSPEELKEKYEAKQKETGGVLNWFKKNWKNLIAAALTITVIALLFVFFPPAAFLAGALALKLAGFMGLTAVASISLSYALFGGSSPTDSEGKREMAATFNNPVDLKKYNDHVDDRMKYYKQDDTKPPKTKNQWVEWKAKQEVFENMREIRLKQLREQESKLARNLGSQSRDEAFKPAHVNRVLGEARLEIIREREKLDEQEVELFAEMGMVPRAENTLAAAGLDPQKAAGKYHVNKGRQDDEKVNDAGKAGRRGAAPAANNALGVEVQRRPRPNAPPE